MNNYTYTDHVAGKQTEKFSKLSDIIKYIEDFGWNGDSEGTVFENDDPIIEYVSREDGLTWRATQN